MNYLLLFLNYCETVLHIQQARQIPMRLKPKDKVYTKMSLDI